MPVISNLLGISPKGIFPKVTIQVRISQVATSQMFDIPSGNLPNVVRPLKAPQAAMGPKPFG